MNAGVGAEGDAGRAVSTIMRDYATVEQWQTDIYLDLHRNPELSMQETRTRGVIARELETLGYRVDKIGGGLVGTLDNGPGATVMLRADFDALPVREETGLDYASTATAVNPEGQTVPVMHACGHDCHVASLLAMGR
ncbi:M20/M25/M40 family metallo-hydrolase [Corynebacterium propinquum]|uniref:M20/M25/M40 family metallo-hydrolase n=1 Tax=Corynebacterium propinquum TaxID=43769 RepID=UPI000AF8ECB5